MALITHESIDAVANEPGMGVRAGIGARTIREATSAPAALAAQQAGHL